ncbi:hypothetical protein RYZ26_04845 [Terasakiella sp. A23]|uniref:hypothetical protein n=1 Tax=Terasakiella sp. FCG-A23 TaxID=3080561 RepID=UPI0029532156|nr:hypothetical protein [Terasakiella sp. A23]MDV7338906.1 hypothetical protein [Terasakiella sp. A23]
MSDSTIATAEKDNGPDWEKIFTDPERGLISLLERSDSKEKLLQVFEVILGTLFDRDGDSAIKERYINELKFFTSGDKKTFEGCVSISKTILLTIKEDRLQKASQAAVVEAEPVRRVEKKKDKKLEQLGEIIMGDYSKTLNAIALGTTDGPLGKTPFILSPEFHEAFCAAFEGKCLDRMALECAQFAKDNPRYQKDYEEVFTKNTLKDLNFREKAWDVWREVWSDELKPHKLPKKPAAPKGVKALGAAFSNKHTEALSEWEDACFHVKEYNLEFENFTKTLCSPHDQYDAPTADDITLMVKIFGMTPNVFEKQITGIHQLIEQDIENKAGAFAEFAGKRNIDLSLLYVFYKTPDYILGEENYLTLLMRSYKKSQVQGSFPYTFKYLQSYIA